MIHIWHVLAMFPTEQRQEVILFYSNCTKRNMVDYKVHLHHGGQHDITNLHYITNKEYRNKYEGVPKICKLKEWEKEIQEIKKQKTQNKKRPSS